MIPAPRSLFLLALAFLTAAFPARAEDQPVPVRHEPKHKVVLENNYVRVIDVQIPEGGETLFHTHETPSVMVYLTHTTNESQIRGESAWTPRTTTPGDSRFAAYDKKPLTHRVRNPGPGLFHVYDIELLRHPFFVRPFSLIESQFLHAHWKERTVRSLTLDLVPGGHRSIPPGNGACLLVQISGVLTIEPTAGQSRRLQPGEFFFQPAGSGFLVTNATPQPLETVILELR